jgi:hypothetical protein
VLNLKICLIRATLTTKSSHPDEPLLHQPEREHNTCIAEEADLEAGATATSYRNSLPACTILIEQYSTCGTLLLEQTISAEQVPCRKHAQIQHCFRHMPIVQFMHESLPNKSRGLNLIASILLICICRQPELMYVSDKFIKSIALNLQIQTTQGLFHWRAIFLG